MVDDKLQQYQTGAGIGVRRSVEILDYNSASDELAEELDSRLGVLLASSFEFPGRYTRWDLGFSNPPLQLVGRDRRLQVRALNRRGEVLLPEIYHAIAHLDCIGEFNYSPTELDLTVAEADRDCVEELRSRRPSLFSLLREIVACFRSDKDAYLGLYGAFGYDLTFQFEGVRFQQQREPTHRNLVLYLPDQVTVADHRIGRTLRYNYEFVCRSWYSATRSETTGGFRRSGETRAYTPAGKVTATGDHAPGEYAAKVRLARQYFERGDLFEVVPGQVYYEPCMDTPSAVFKRLKKHNPAPYGAIMNLGEQEYLVAASPEMFVRVEGRQIETCPISGTIRRGDDALGDARQIKTLLNSEKDEAELSMCTDVDRNDKARVCEPGSVEVIGRRQIEMYSRLIHTVDHVKGSLREEFDALDGFLAHTWAVTVTGAPKLAAMQFIEEQENSPRHWYGGALGQIGFNGNLNTGLTLRTIRINQGVAEIRAGATLLFDSDPELEEQETRLKAAALIDAVRDSLPDPEFSSGPVFSSADGAGLSVLMVDHQDSFVHNLAAYFRQCGVALCTMRPAMAQDYLKHNRVDLVVLSPGPSMPRDFDMTNTIAISLEQGVSLFGVCLGLQGIVEYFGGSLAQLDYPMHGKPSTITHCSTKLFDGIAREFEAGRYHSLVAETVPDCLEVTATTGQGVVMAVEHRTLPVSAVQFHPESIMSLEAQAGYKLVRNVVAAVATRRKLSKTG
ncbi:MAG: anthranilate synthase component I [Gammaproteobacteria bacterium]